MMIKIGEGESVLQAVWKHQFRDMTDLEWRQDYEMLCGDCDKQFHCDLIEGLIEYRRGERDEYPENAWRYCEHAGVTCESYETRTSNRRETELPKKKDFPAQCGGCATREGTDASQCLHTQRDLDAAVKHGFGFMCHEREGVLCRGWCERRSELLEEEGVSCG